MAKLFEEGTESSAGDLMAALQDLSNKGQSVLDDIKTTRGNTLFRFEQGLSALNARRQRAARVNAPDIACRFLVSDMLDIDQAKTSATIRYDARVVSLKERNNSSEIAKLL